MKKLFCLLALILGTKAIAQWTGQGHYNHANPAILSAGTYVQTNPGFVMAGYLPTTTAMQPSIYIDKTDPDGSLTFGFSQEYLMFHACPSPMSQRLTCYGVSLVESSGGGYALAAAFDDGCVFATLDASGNVLVSLYFNFFQGATQITQPVICESASSPGNYYVAGFFKDNLGQGFLYTLKLTSAGGVIFNTFHGFGSTANVPRGVLESNYGGVAKLALCGYTELWGNGTKHGLVALLDASNGSMIAGEQVAIDLGNGTDECFNSIALAASNSGYILGGSTTLGSLRPLWVRLNQNLTLNALSVQNTSFQSGEILSVAERFSTFYSSFEYYGAASSASGMLVLKVGSGLMAPFPPAADNEFLYNLGIGTSEARCLSIDNVPTSANVGIHVFGNSASLPAGDFFLNMACFNGATGSCGVPTEQDHAVSSGWSSPSATINIMPPWPGGWQLPQCSSQILASFGTFTSPGQLCLLWGVPTMPYAGSNNRTTSAGPSLNKDADLKLHPNPACTELFVSSPVQISNLAQYSLITNSGQIRDINSCVIKSENDNVKIEIDRLDLVPGLYFLSVQDQDIRFISKFAVE